MRQWFTNLMIVLLTLLSVAALGELTVRALQHQDYLSYYGKPLKKQKTVKLRKTYAPKFIPSANPKLFVEFDPADPQVNELGMRGPLPSHIKPKGIFRIAVLGDSVAFGYGLEDAKSFPRQLEASLNRSGSQKVEIINFAVCGYGLEAYSEVYRTKIRTFKPDLVILGYVLNDPAPTKIVFSAIGAQMKQKAKLKRIGKYSQFAAWVVDKSSQAMDSYTSTQMFNDSYFEPENRKIMDEELMRLRSLTNEDSTPLVTFIFPYFHNMQNYPMEKVHGVVAEALQHAGIQYHDLLEDYRPYDGISLRLEPGDYTHPNAEGQRIAAQAMEDYLKKEKIF